MRPIDALFELNEYERLHIDNIKYMIIVRETLLKRKDLSKERRGAISLEIIKLLSCFTIKAKQKIIVIDNYPRRIIPIEAVTLDHLYPFELVEPKSKFKLNTGKITPKDQRRMNKFSKK